MNKRNLQPKRTFFPLLLILLLSAVGMTNAMAQTFTQGNLNYSINSDGASVTVTGHMDGTSATGELVIPESVEYYNTQYTVTIIAASAFSGCSGLTGSLIIPESVTSIGVAAFSGCSGLTGSLTIPDAVTFIGNVAFSNCSGFSGVLTIGSSLAKTGQRIFENCSGFTTLNYNAVNCNLMNIRISLDRLIVVTSEYQGGYYYEPYYHYHHWLSGCSSLTTVSIGDNVQKIPYCFLEGCNNVEGELELPETVTAIQWNAFSNCSGFTGSLTIPNSVTEIGNNAFYNCIGFSALNFNATNCTSLSSSWLEGISSLTSLSIGESVQRIPDDFVNGKSTITGSLTIPNSVTYIGANAFSGCNGFSGTLSLGNSVMQIGNTAFFGACQGFTSFVALPETPPTLGNSVFVSANYGLPVAVPCGSLEAYQGAEGWNVFTNIQEQNPCLWVITAEAGPASGGTVSGIGIYAQGQTCTLVASPNEDFSFVNWTEDGVEVSTDAEYAFTVTESRHLVANFNIDNAIGNGIATNQYLPSYSYYPYSLTQQIYTADEIGQMGVVNWVAFYNAGSQKTRNFDLYLVHTEKTNFSSSNDWVAVTNADKVFSGNVNMVSNDWTIIYFDTPFAYNGITNVILVVDDNTGDWNSGLACRVFNATGQAIRIYGDGANYNPSSPSGYNGSIMNVKNQIAFGFSSVDAAVFATVSPEGAGSVSGEGAYQLGETCTLTATPSSNDYVFVNWTENGEVVSNNAQYSFTVTGDRILVANFLRFRVDITSSAFPEEGGTVNGGGSYLLGQTCTLTATPNDGYAFVNWMENGQEVSTNANYSFTVTGSRTLEAHFVDPVGMVQTLYWPINTNPGSPYVTVTWGGGANPFEAMIGDETSTNSASVMPFNTYYKYSISEALFRANELAQAGVTTAPMTSLSWEAIEVTTNQPQNNISIWMANVPDTQLTNTSHIATNMTLVYTGNIGVPPLGWNEFVFNEGSFAWDGTSNVLVLCQRNNGQWNGTVNWRSHNPGFYGMTNKSQDYTPYDVMTQTYDVARINTSRPNTLFKSFASETSDYYYKVYRTGCDDNSYTLIADSVSESKYYVDSSWLQLPLGSYQYGVSFIKNDGSESGIVTSNCIERSLYTYQIAATPNLASRGTVSGAGEYALGATCTLTATPIGNNTFTCWKENGTVVSTDANYSFIVTAPRNLVAVFSVSPDDIIVFADNNVKALCVNNWDIDGDGELAYDEAATVTNLGNVFQNKSGITSFNELQYFTGLTSIGQQAFYNCYNLNSITLPNGVTSIGYRAFYGCSSLAGTHDFPNAVTSIGEEAFMDCTSITGLNLPAYLSSIGSSAFRNCSGIRGEITLPASLWSVGGYAFYGCDGISTVNYNATNCSSFGSAGNPVFYDCAFPHLNIGANVQRIPDYAFKRCFMITDMNVAAVNPPTVHSSTFGMVPRSIPVTVPMGSGDAYRSAQYWEEFFNIIEGNMNNMQISPLAEGWNWWSSYIELTDSDGLSQLENSIGSAGMVIKSRTNGYVEAYQYNGETNWYGTLGSINNEQMYKIRTNAACNAIIVGDLASPANHPITINNGWNWIGFPCNQNVSVNVALSGFTPANNDIIKGRNGYTTYYSDANYSVWYGTLNTFEPGKGYMYRSNSSTTKTLTFQMGRGEAANENITTENNHYRPNGDSYADNMTITAVLELNGEELRSDDYELAAFVGDECRGSVQLMYVEPIDRYIAFLMVYGEQSETLSFRLTDGTQSGMSSDDMAYVADGVAGTMTDPVTLRFETLGVDQNEALDVVVYPNPSEGVFNIQGQDIRKIEVFNAYGQVVVSKEIKNDCLQIDLSPYPSGVFMLRVITDKGMAKKQIIKH